MNDKPTGAEWMNIKDDKRPQRGWWAPGGYYCSCVKCGAHFAGDKRAEWCADCAYKMTLMQSELSECLEGVRKNLMDDHIPEFTQEAGRITRRHDDPHFRLLRRPQHRSPSGDHCEDEI